MSIALSIGDSGLQPGVFWPGRLPSDWRVKRLKFVARLLSEKAVYRESDPPYMGLEHIESWTGRYLEDEEASPDGVVSHFEPGDVLFGKLRPYLAKVHLARHRGVCSTEALVLRAYEELLPEYLRYFLVAPVTIENINSSTYGSKMPRASWDFIGNQLQPLPPLTQQQKIAAFLDRKTAEIDTLIEKKRRLLGLLAEKRTALITRAVTKGLDPDVPTKDSGIEWLGEIPAHWDVARLKNITQLESGHTPSKSKPEFWVNCEIPWVSLRDTKTLADNDYIAQTHTHINTAGLEGSSARLLPAGTVIFTRDATVGLAAITEEEMAVSQHLIAWIPSERVDKEYLLFVFEAMREYLHSLEFGSTVRTIGMDDIRRLVGPVPPLSEQLKIVDYFLTERGRLTELETRINEAIEKLKEYRAALITNAVTGQIKVA